MKITTFGSAPLQPNSAPMLSALTSLETRVAGPVDGVRLREATSLSTALPLAPAPSLAPVLPTVAAAGSQAAVACGLVAFAPAAATAESVKAMIETRPRPQGEAAREVATRLVSGFEADIAALYATSGFENREALLAAVNASTATAQRAASILVDENLEVGMAAKPEARDGVVQKGFLNFRDSSTSEGAVMGRETVEANYAGMDVDRYTALDGELKPKYGYLAPKPDSGLSTPVGVRSYGSDRWIFNLDRVRDRMTFTVGDSLNRHVNYTGGSDTTATTWDQRFTPWNHRELAAPAMAGGLDQEKLGLQMDVWRESLENMQNEWPSLKHVIQLTEGPDPKTPVEWAPLELGITPPPGSLEKYTVAWGPSLDYVEVQMWGPLDLGDVKAFEFTDKPPDGAFLEALNARGIEIRDGRQQPPRLWS